MCLCDREREVERDKERRHTSKCFHTEDVYKPTMCRAPGPILGTNAKLKKTDCILLVESDESYLELVEFKITAELSNGNKLKNSWTCMCGALKRREGRDSCLKVICIEVIDVIIATKR